MHLTVAAISTLVTLAASRSTTTRASCPCGYTVNATRAPEGWAQFTEIFESDFIHTADLEADDDGTWIPQEYQMPRAGTNGPYGKESMVENVVTNSNGRPHEWNGPGPNGTDPGLQLWVKSNLVDAFDYIVNPMVPIAEIVSARDDILYGSFRIGMRTSQVPGTCGAFFFYRDDSAEIDMEFLSKDQPLKDKNKGFVNLVLHTPESKEVGYVDPTSPNSDNHTLAFNPGMGFHEYRIDWLPDRVDFFVDNKWLTTMRENVPKTPGRIHVSHWSDGNNGWSGGPPDEDALMTVTYIKAYFNSSDEDVVKSSTAICRNSHASWPKSACHIPDQTVPPEPSGPHGNATANTWFFTLDMAHVNEDGTPKASATPDPRAHKSDANSMKDLGMSSFLSVSNPFLHSIIGLILTGILAWMHAAGGQRMPD